MSRPGALCYRCGAVLPDLGPASDDPVEGECPECGSGYSTGRILRAYRRPFGSRLLRRRMRPAVEYLPPEVLARRDEAVASCTFPVYGLDSTWTGRRWMGGWGGSGGRLELAHGDVWDEAAPLVRIETRPPTGRPSELGIVAKSLAQRLWREGARHEDVRGSFSADPTESWAVVEFVVDGEPVPFRRLSSAPAQPYWAAVGHINNQLVSVWCRSVAQDLHLVTISDLRPYLADDGRPGSQLVGR